MQLEACCIGDAAQKQMQLYVASQPAIDHQALSLGFDIQVHPVARVLKPICWLMQAVMIIADHRTARNAQTHACNYSGSVNRFQKSSSRSCGQHAQCLLETGKAVSTRASGGQAGHLLQSAPFSTTISEGRVRTV